MEESYVLEVKGLKKYFPIVAGILRHKVGEVKAVDGIDFKIRKGEIFGLVGESGSGKSTAARAAIRLVEPTAGEINFLGKPLLSYSHNALKGLRTEIQMVFQDPYSSLNPRKTIASAVGEGLAYHGVITNERALDEAVVETLSLVGLPSEFRHLYPHELSGGQQQRVCIGRAIALKPKLLVCDEAVSALDVSVRAQILNLLLDLKEKLNLSILFITHDLSVVRHICHDIAVMHQGKIVEMQKAEELFLQPKDSYTKKLLKAIPITNPNNRSI